MTKTQGFPQDLYVYETFPTFSVGSEFRVKKPSEEAMMTSLFE